MHFKTENTVAVLTFMCLTIITAEVRTKSFTIPSGSQSTDELLPCLLSCMENDCEAVSLAENGECNIYTQHDHWHPEIENNTAYVKVENVFIFFIPAYRDNISSLAVCLNLTLQSVSVLKNSIMFVLSILSCYMIFIRVIFALNLLIENNSNQ